MSQRQVARLLLTIKWNWWGFLKISFNPESNFWYRLTAEAKSSIFWSYRLNWYLVSLWSVILSLPDLSLHQAPRHFSFLLELIPCLTLIISTDPLRYHQMICEIAYNFNWWFISMIVFYLGRSCAVFQFSLHARHWQANLYFSSKYCCLKMKSDNDRCPISSVFRTHLSAIGVTSKGWE